MREYAVETNTNFLIATLMTLIGDCGSTKCEWITANQTISTTGINALIMSDDEIAKILITELAPHLSPSQITEIHYYGAGCIGGEVNEKVGKTLKSVFQNANHIEVQSDLIAACRALFRDTEGIACILGTGSNSCHYNGTEVVQHTMPLGYILGDEGSGAALGKRFVNAVLKGLLPKHICDRFFQSTNLCASDIIQSVYRKPNANRFLASFCPLLLEMTEEKEVMELVEDEFVLFFERNILQYSNCRKLPVSFIGSIAVNFAQALNAAAKKHGITIAETTKSPIPGLIKYHNITH